MIGRELFNDGTRRWVFFGRDPERKDNVIDTNEYLVVHGGKGLLTDPGGMEIFPQVVTAISREVEVADVEAIFASHQDPDIISSMALWLGLNDELKVYASWVWSTFIPHFGGGRAITPIPDEGMVIPLGAGNELQAIPAHYCHASGNFSLYDPRARILFSGDVGAALLPDANADLFVTDFQAHTKYMEGFHKRWMPSNRAKNRWIERVRALDVDMMCPQHGAIFKGDDVQRFLDWFADLEVGGGVV